MSALGYYSKNELKNYKYRRYLDNLPPINDWNELKREMNREFLPLNYRQTLFRQFQSLVQGSRSVDEYTLDFYQLEARNQLNEIEDQRVARFLHGLRSNIQDALIVHTFSCVSEAQSKAKAVEQQLTRNQNFTPRTSQIPNRTQNETPKNANQPPFKPNTNLSSSHTPLLSPNSNNNNSNDRRANIWCN
jgi:Retrotransposon gag protein